MVLQRGHPETSDSSEGAEVNGEEEEKRKKKKKKEKKHKKHKSNETGSEVRWELWYHKDLHDSASMADD